MFTIPTGGLSIFIYGFILVIGGVIRMLKKLHMPLLGTHRMMLALVSQEGDCALRRFMSWSIAITLPILLFVGVFIALLAQVKGISFSPPTTRHYDAGDYYITPLAQSSKISSDTVLISLNSSPIQHRNALFKNKSTINLP